MSKLFLYFLRFFYKGWDVSFLVLLPFIQKIYHISLVQIGFLSMVYTIASIVSAFYAGHINDRLGNKNTVVAAITLYVVAWFGFVLVRSPLPVWFLFIIGGMSAGVLAPITDAIVMKQAESGKRSKEIGDLAAVGDLGRIAFTTCATLLVGLFTLRLTALLFSMMAAGFLIFLLMRKVAGEVHIKDETVQPVRYCQLIGSKEYVLSLLTGLTDTFASSSLFIFLPFLLIPKGIDIKVTGFFTAVFFAGYFSGRLLLGRTGDRYGKTAVLIVAEVAMAILTVSLVYVNAFWLIAVNLFLLGAVTRGTSPLIKAMVADAIKIDHFEKGYSLYSSSIRTSNSLSRPVYSVAGSMWGVGSIFYLSGIVALLTLVPATLFYKTVAKK